MTFYGLKMFRRRLVLMHFCENHRGTIIKRANRYIAFRAEESTVAENKEYFPEKNKEYFNKYKTIFSAYEKNFEVLFGAHSFFNAKLYFEENKFIPYVRSICTP